MESNWLQVGFATANSLSENASQLTENLKIGALRKETSTYFTTSTTR